MFHPWGFWFDLLIGSKHFRFHVSIFLLLGLSSAHPVRKTSQNENTSRQLKSLISHPQRRKITFFPIFQNIKKYCKLVYYAMKNKPHRYKTKLDIQSGFLISLYTYLHPKGPWWKAACLSNMWLEYNLQLVLPIHPHL